MTHTPTDLLPCPFCGNIPDGDSHYINQGTKWGGILCCIEGPDVRTDYKPWPHFKTEAIAAWNTRAIDPQITDALSPADNAYYERNQVVAALAKVFPSGIAKTAIDGWDEAWHNCVYIDLPTGQVSWHYHNREAHLFEGLPKYKDSWDGHDTPEKYRRLNTLARTPDPQITAQLDALTLSNKRMRNALILVSDTLCYFRDVGMDGNIAAAGIELIRTALAADSSAVQLCTEDKATSYTNDLAATGASAVQVKEMPENVSCTELTKGDDHIGDTNKMVLDDWLPMESAPKNGDLIDIFVKGKNYSTGVYFEERFADCCWEKESSKEGWYSPELNHQCGAFIELEHKLTVTHWRPVPKPPQAMKGGSNE